MSYKGPLASTTDFGVVRVGTGITVTNGVISSTLGLLNYGFVTSNTTQTNPVASAVNLTTFTSASPANGVTIVAGTQITVANAGVYTKLFTLNMRKTAGGNSTVSVWLRLNGANIAGSAQNIVLAGSNIVTFVSGNFTLTLAAGDNLQLCWSSSDTTVSLLNLAAAAGPTRPTGFAAKITLTRIS